MSKVLKLNNQKAIETFLQTIVKEATSDLENDLMDANTTVREKQKQSAVASNIYNSVGNHVTKEEDDMSEEEDDFFSDTEDEKKNKKKEKEPKSDSEKKDDEKDSGEDDEEKNNLPKYMHTDLPPAEDVTPEMITDRINVIRSGRSTKDEKVKAEIKHYFDDLSNPERLSLLAFLTGLAQIITTSSSGEEASAPEDASIDVDAPQKPKQDSTNNVEQKPQQNSQEPPKQKGKENTTPPIKVVRK